MATTSVFHFPIRTPIANAKVKLVPFDPARHSAAFVAQTRDRPDLFSHMPPGPFGTAEELRAEFTTNAASAVYHANPAVFAFAIVDKTRPASPEDGEGELAGTVGYINASAVNLSAEIGMIVVLPGYQRTHVATHAVGLLLGYGMGSPGEGGIGLRRMHWHCSAANLASARVAERMGYEKVGVIPYHFRFPKGKTAGKVGNGRALPPGSDPDDVWRDTMVFSLSWDVWEREAREKVLKAMSR